MISMCSVFHITATLILLSALSACSTATDTLSSAAKNSHERDLDLPASKHLMALMERAANWQIPRLERLDYITFRRWQAESPKEWMQATMYIGLTAVAERSTNPFYEKWIGYKSQEWNWELAPRTFHADDHLIGSTYLWYGKRHSEQANALKNVQATFDTIIRENPNTSLEFTADHSCAKRWCWADALFMAPPAWFELSNTTGDKRYAEYAHKEFQATVDYLYNTELDLVYRDSRYFKRTSEFGEPIFWARGSGWVYGGIARVLQALPDNHPYKPYYENLFIKMSAALKKLQKKDGSWATSLLAGEKIPSPETSGTGFFTFGMAWGLKVGLLSEEDYLQTTLKGWKVLSDALHADGKLGWVQGVSAEPGKVSFNDSQIYGVGAFLLAASHLYDLSKMKELGIQNPNTPTFIFEGIRDFVPHSFQKVVFYADEKNQSWAINAAKENQRQGFARADMAVPLSLHLKNQLNYTITLVTQGEIDGESRYQIHCDDTLLGEFKNPKVKKDYEEVSFVILAVDLSGCKRIGVSSEAHTNGSIPEGNGTAYARGRWSRLTLTPAPWQNTVRVVLEPRILE